MNISLKQFPTAYDIKNYRYAILPIGSHEQHGPHLPVDTDSIIASAVAHELSKLIPDSYLLPCIPFSSSFEHTGFHAISLRVKTIYAVINDIVRSLAQYKMPCIILNFHFGNSLLSNIVQELNHDGYNVMLAPTQRHLKYAYNDAGLVKTPSEDMHAGEAETSLLLYIALDSVRTDKIQDTDIPFRPLLNTVGFKGYSETGTIGFPSLATREKGKNLLKYLTKHIHKSIKEFTDGLPKKME